MTSAQKNEAWNTYWAHKAGSGAQSSAANRNTDAMPEAWRGIALRQRAVWQSFARALPKGAEVLDLATGDGDVLVSLYEARSDLKLTGIDRAQHLPEAPHGITLTGGLSMEQLPFSDARFDAVSSQFGFEYGDLAKVAAEAARVLKPRGRLGLLTHRVNGPIVAHNRTRRAQIAWALEEQQLTEAARAYLATRDSIGGEIPARIARGPQAGAAAHGESSAAWEIAEAIRQTLAMGKSDTAANVLAIIADIEAQAQNELGRIASLETAAANASDEDAFFAALENAGFTFASEAMVSDGHHPAPFADYRTFVLTG